MAKKKTSGAAASSRWRLVDCATNTRTWNPRWQDTRGLAAVARRDDLVALNAYGTVRLFGVRDRHDVQTLGSIELPELGGLPEDFPLGFDRHGRVVQVGRDALHVVDVSDPMRPTLVESRELSPPLRGGTFVDGVLYRTAMTGEAMFAHDGAQTTPFGYEPTSTPYAFARVGEYLYAFGAGDDVEVIRLADLSRVGSRACSVAYDVHALSAPEVEIVVATSSTDTRILDVAKPFAPKCQKQLYKHEARGAGVAGKRLYLVDGIYEGPQSLTTIELGRPSTIVGREPFTTEPELGCGYLFLDVGEREIFALTKTARFVVLTCGGT